MDMKDKKKICSSKKDEKNSLGTKAPLGGNLDAPEGRGFIAARFHSPPKGVKPGIARLVV